MMPLQSNIDTTLGNTIEKAADFHGHLGPFLVMGVRIGLIGLRELELKQGAKRLQVTASLKYSVPFSCVLDGIQVATGCTFGNKKLTLIDSHGIAAKFRLPNQEQTIVAVNQTVFNKLKKELLSKRASNHEVEELARLIASTPEKDLFVTKKK